MKYKYRIMYRSKPVSDWLEFDIEPESEDEAIDFAIQAMHDDIRTEVGGPLEWQ